MNAYVDADYNVSAHLGIYSYSQRFSLIMKLGCLYANMSQTYTRSNPVSVLNWCFPTYADLSDNASVGLYMDIQ